MFGVDTTFDVAEWFLDQAMGEREYLQPQKLNKLLYLAYGYYTLLNPGKKLMPASFIVTEQGPLEPNVYRLYELGRPGFERSRIKETESTFLKSIWRKFGQYSSDKLCELTLSQDIVQKALVQGKKSEITHEAIVKHFARKKEEMTMVKTQRAELIKKMEGGKMLRSQHGKAVIAKAWAPKRKKPANP